jgi:hypothetical protein
MFKQLVILGSMILAMVTSVAKADHVSIGIGIGVTPVRPVYVVPAAPVYTYSPIYVYRPVYVAPAPTVVYATPTYVYPTYVSPTYVYPSYLTPAPVYVAPIYSRPIFEIGIGIGGHRERR